MKEKFKQLKPIQNMMVLAFLVTLFILTTQTSAMAQPVSRAQIAVSTSTGTRNSEDPKTSRTARRNRIDVRCYP